MTIETQTQPTEDIPGEGYTLLAPSLKSFVQTVKQSLASKIENPVQSLELIKNAALLERIMSGGNGHPNWGTGSSDGDALMSDPILHHRVILAAGIAKSVAAGSDLSGKRRKILQSNIEYIEGRL